MLFSNVSVIVAVIIVIVTIIVIYGNHTSRQKKPKEKLKVSVGLIGLSLENIERIAGKASLTESLGGNMMACTWESKYSVVILKFEKENGIWICNAILGSEVKEQA